MKLTTPCKHCKKKQDCEIRDVLTNLISLCYERGSSIRIKASQCSEREE